MRGSTIPAHAVFEHEGRLTIVTTREELAGPPRVVMRASDGTGDVGDVALPLEQVHSAARAPDGTIWIAGGDTLGRFDGSTFTPTFTRTPVVGRVVVDGAGRVVLAGDVEMLVGDGTNFEPIPVPPLEDDEYVPGNTLRGSAIDVAPDGTVIASAYAGSGRPRSSLLFRLNSTRAQRIGYLHEQDVNGLVMLDSNRMLLWVTTSAPSGESPLRFVVGQR